MGGPKKYWELTQGRWEALEDNAKQIYQDYSNEVKRVLKEQSAEKPFGFKIYLGGDVPAEPEDLEELTQTLQLLTESNVVYICLYFVN